MVVTINALISLLANSITLNIRTTREVEPNVTRLPKGLPALLATGSMNYFLLPMRKPSAVEEF